MVEELDAAGLGQQALDRPARARERGGKPFTRTSLYRLLTNVVYVGKVRYKDEVHAGEHTAIVEPALFQKAQAPPRAQRRDRRGPASATSSGRCSRGCSGAAPAAAP